MTVTAFRQKGVTVVTVASDSNSMLPPLCQILKSLCYSPRCCSVIEGLLQTNVVSALGAIMIMVGLFNIGLGPGRMSYHPEDLTYWRAAYWLGGVYIAAGAVSVVASRFPSRCLVGFAAFVNIIGSIFAIVGIVMYAIDLSESSVGWMCDWDATGNPDRCKFVAYFAQRLLTGMDVTLIVMAVLQLCVCISFAVLGIKALCNIREVEQGDGDRDVEIYRPVLPEDVLTGPGA